MDDHPKINFGKYFNRGILLILGRTGKDEELNEKFLVQEFKDSLSVLGEK